MDKPTSNLLNGDLLDVTQKKKIVTDESSTSDSDSEPITTTAARSVSSSSAPSTKKTSKPRCSNREDFTLPLLKYIAHTAKTLVLTFLFDWSQIIRHPIGSLTTLVVYPVSSGIMVVVSVAFRLGSRFKRKQQKVHSKIFDDDRRPLVEQAGIYLDNKLLGLKVDAVTKITHYEDYADPCYKKPSFSIDVAELLLMLSALMYEREHIDCIEDKSEEDMEDMVALEADDNNIEIVNSGRDQTPNEIQEEENEYKVEDGEKKKRDHSILYILRKANKWGLRFYKLSELGTETSPFCGAFYSEKHNFIVIAFKGTTPTDFAEWAVDATFMRTSGKTQLFGE
ncbi:6308_t:CDS:2, partial [Paraglomus occultum]